MPPRVAVAAPHPAAGRSRDHGLGSNRHGEVIERHGDPPVRRRLDRELIVATANVLQERMAGDDHPGAAVLPEPASVAAAPSTGRDRKLVPILASWSGWPQRSSRWSWSRGGHQAVE